jgi:hypothetical protein
VAIYEELAERLAPAPVRRTPLLGSDVHDLVGLATMADHLFGAAGRVGEQPEVG